MCLGSGESVGRVMGVAESSILVFGVQYKIVVLVRGPSVFFFFGLSGVFFDTL